MKRFRLIIGALAVVAGASGILAIAAQPGSRAANAGLVLLVVATSGLTGTVVMRAARRLYGVISRVERQVAANHKRASVWDARLHRRLDATDLAGEYSPHGSPATTGVASVVTDGRTSARWKNHPQARLLLDAGIFDADYYAAITNGYFARAYDAASHYLSLNAEKGIAPTPFIAMDRLPQQVRATVGRGDVKPLLAYLRSAEVFGSELSDVFVPDASGISPRAAHLHIGGVVGAFLERLDERTPLPVPPDSIRAGGTAAQLRHEIIVHARGVHEANRLAGSREQSTWDAEHERRWLAELAEHTGELPLVSVVMPVKNRAHVIGEAIASVQAQTHESWELVVVDDGSDDGTRELVQDLGSDDPRISVVRNVGAGVSAARNTGLDQARGSYVAFLDSDNTWVPHFLETMLGAMERDGLGAAYAAVAIDPGTGKGLRYRAYSGGRDHLRVLNHIDLNVLVVRDDVRREAGRFDESLRRWVDHDFALKVSGVAEPELLPFIGCEYDHSDQASDRITVKESEHWQWAVLGRHWVDWDDAAATVPGRLSVVIPTYNDSTMTIACVESVLTDADASGIDVEVIVVDNGSRIEVGQTILSRLGVSDRLRYHRLPRNLNFAIGCNVGAARASGEHVLFLNNDTLVRRGALGALVETMGDPDVVGAQPLLVYGDETIQTAGTVFSARDSLPGHLLTGHPPADADGLAGVAFDAATAAALVMRAHDLRSLRGFDAIFVNGMEDADLCLRARDEVGGHFAVVPSAVVTHLESKTPGRGRNVIENRRLFLERWRGRLPGPQDHIYRAAGFTIAAVGTDGRDVPGPKPVVVRDGADRRTRWGINIASIPGPRGDQWGDTHFAASLKASLERAGQSVVVHRHGAHSTPAAAFDDVNLVIRGLDRVSPMPGKVNILWVISHPDAVSVDEIRSFDLVFAASLSWSRKMTELSGREVVPLFQATDPARFNTDVAPIPFDGALFVGGTHPGRERPVVSGALEAGVDLGVYGPGWDRLLPPEVLLGSYVDNASLAGHYRGARRVLADHWDLMASEGFVQNRLFDAVASGCRVVSDDVVGLDEIFGGAVQVYTSPDDLSRLCDRESTAPFPDDAEMDKIAALVREQHSFDRRAEELVRACRSVSSPSHEAVAEQTRRVALVP